MIILDLKIKKYKKRNTTMLPWCYRNWRSEKAIIKTIQKLVRGDILLVAGKGHENSQEINGRHLNFDDAKIIRSVIN